MPTMRRRLLSDRCRGRRAGGYAPTAYRERIKALGPQNHPQHGKQAEGGHDIDLVKQAHGIARSAGRHNLIKLKK